jgi:hypothetical protein
MGSYFMGNWHWGMHAKKTYMQAGTMLRRLECTIKILIKFKKNLKYTETLCLQPLMFMFFAIWTISHPFNL